MQISIGWLFLVTPVVFTLGLFVGENWSKWDKRSREKHCNQEPEWWFKKQAD